MRSTKNGKAEPEMRAEYDFTEGVRGKYSASYKKGSNVIVLDPDVARVFKSSKQVNDILRTLSKIAGQKIR
jgi:hypothetical protein